MKQQGKYCHNEFDIEDFSPCAIRQIMETEWKIVMVSEPIIKRKFNLDW